MEAGKLNKRITIQKKIVTYNSLREPISTWSDGTTIWAEVITSGGREFYAAQKVNTETSAVFRIRYRSGINSLMRIKYGNQYFSILSAVDPDGCSKELLISGKEVL